MLHSALAVDQSLGPDLSNAQQFVGLQAQPPLWMSQTIRHGSLSVGCLIGPASGCRKNFPERQIHKLLWLCVLFRLRINQFQLIALEVSCKDAFALGLTQASIQSGRRGQGSVGFHRDFKTALMQGDDQRFIQLQQRFAASANDIRRCFAEMADRPLERQSLPPEVWHRQTCCRPSHWFPQNRWPQNRQMATVRSAARPLHRLQPANRQNTAGRPVRAPSPCSV